MTEPLTSCGDSAKSVATNHPLNNLPYHVFSSAALTPRFCVVIGKVVLTAAAVS